MRMHVYLLICTVSKEPPLYVWHIDLTLHRLLWGEGVDTVYSKCNVYT
jgi:hypothetical protein